MHIKRLGWIVALLSMVVCGREGIANEPVDGQPVSALRPVNGPILPINVVHFPPAIRTEQMKPHVEFLAGPKCVGRSGPAKKAARDYVVRQFREASLKPLFAGGPQRESSTEQKPDSTFDGDSELMKPSTDGGFLQIIPGSDKDDGTKAPVLGHNIGGWIPGSDPKLADQFIIIGAHYDHLGQRNGAVFSGADDNASGVAMMIEVARHLASSKKRLRRSVVFVGFDLEEHLLWGSRWFAANPPWPLKQVSLFITADMIGRSLGDLPLPTVFVLGSEHANELKRTLDRIGAPQGLDVCRLGTDLVGTRSDYGPFRDREVPYLFFSTGEHPDYHSPRDTPDRLNYEKASQVASLVLEVARDVADADEVPVWQPATAGDLDEPRALLRITTLLLEAGDKKPLTSTQRFLVTNVRNRTQQILKAEKMTADDRLWLIRMSQLLLLSVF